MTKLRWYQIRLRTIAIGVTLIAIGLASWGAIVRPYWNQSRLRQELTYLGGVVELRPGPQWLRRMIGGEHCQTITLINLADVNPSSGQLARITTLPNLEVLVLGGESITDDSLRFVPACASLQGVILDSTNVTDAALQELRARSPGVYVGRTDRRIVNEIDHWDAGATSAWADGFAIAENPDVAARLKKRLGPEYFREVAHLSGIPGGDWNRFGPEELALLPRMRRLETLDFCYWIDMRYYAGEDPDHSIYNSVLDGVLALKQLKKLTIYVKDKNWLQKLIAMPNLEDLTVHSEWIAPALTEAEIRELLAILPPLKGLGFPQAALDDLDWLPDWPLERLDLSNTPLEDADLPDLVRRYPNLRELNLQDTYVTDAGLPVLLELQNLETLLLARTRVTDLSYDTLCAFPKLATISVGGYERANGMDVEDRQQPFGVPAKPIPFDRAGLRPAADRVNRLREGLRAGDLPKMAAYHKCGPGREFCTAESLHLDVVRVNPALRVVDLSGTYVDDQGLQHLRAYPAAEVVQLDGTWVTDSGMTALTQLCQLRFVSLWQTRVTSAGIARMAPSPKLEAILLPHTVDRDCVEDLLQMPNLRFALFAASESYYYDALRLHAPLRQFTRDDVREFRRLAKHLFAKADADGDGRVDAKDLVAPDLLEFIPATHQAGGVKDESSFQEFFASMLSGAVLTPEAQAELERVD